MNHWAKCTFKHYFQECAYQTGIMADDDEANLKSIMMADNDGWGKDRLKNRPVVKTKGSWKRRKGPMTTPLKCVKDSELFCIDRSGEGFDGGKESDTDFVGDPVGGAKRGRKAAERTQAKGEEDADCEKKE